MLYHYQISPHTSLSTDIVYDCNGDYEVDITINHRGTIFEGGFIVECYEYGVSELADDICERVEHHINNRVVNNILRVVASDFQSAA